MTKSSFFILILCAIAGGVASCGEDVLLGACTTRSDCPNPPLAKCYSGMCIEINAEHCENNEKDGNESDVDCGGSCAACKIQKKCKIDMDCQSNYCNPDENICDNKECKDNEDCNGHVCLDHGTCATCQDGKKNGSESDVDCGGVCDQCETDKACKKDGDCLSNACENNVCVEPQSTEPKCSNRVIDGDETDVDCGGSCKKCSEGKSCKETSDCTSGLECKDSICMQTDATIETCDNGEQDDLETDVDCGGNCKKCGDGKKCVSTTDCVTGLECNNYICTTNSASCSNGSKDGDETDIDCGGSCQGCGVDRVCNQNSDCISYKCVGGLCAAGDCTEAAVGDVIINEVMTNPNTAEDLLHSSSKQMKYIELYNNNRESRWIQNLLLTVTDHTNTVRNVHLTGCIQGHRYLVIYPQGQTLSALDSDATAQDNADIDAAFPNASTYTITLSHPTNGTMSSATLPDASGASGISTARPISGEDMFCLHNSLIDGENPHSPGLSNDIGKPLG